MVKRGFVRFLVFGFLGLMLSAPLVAASEQPALPAPEGRPWRILYVMSYESSSVWSEEQLVGFKLGLGRDVPVDYKFFELDSKRPDAPQTVAARAKQAQRLIGEWKPDLLFASDDVAIAAVVRPNANSTLPCVFSGMNLSMESHGLSGAKNITGVLEREHFVEAIRLLQQLKPGATRIHLISDQAPHWAESIQRIEKLATTAGGVTLIGVDRLERYADFQRLILENPKKADAYLLLGVFDYKDARGQDVAFEDLQRWVAENSRVPDVSFWTARIKHGTLASVAVSALDQGRKAGLAARQILLEGRSPNTIPVEATSKGVAAINLVRARALGITPRARVLLTSLVSTEYEWTHR